MSHPTPGIPERSPRSRNVIDEFGRLAQNKIDEIYAMYFDLTGKPFTDLYKKEDKDVSDD